MDESVPHVCALGTEDTDYHCSLQYKHLLCDQTW